MYPILMARDFFQGKRIAVIGLGPHGEMVTDIKFLIKAGAIVGVYDVRSEARVKNHLVFLRSIGLANYVCGPIPSEDLLDMDMIILSHEYPRDSFFLTSIREKGIPIEYPETLFFKHAPPVTIVGIMGSCGKATVLSFLAPMLYAACEEQEDKELYIVDPESEEGTLAHLKKIKNNDIILMRIVEPMMKELHAMRISPHIAVFTTVPPKNTYTNNPFEILSYQTYNNYIIGNDHVIDSTHNSKFSTRAKMLRVKPSLIPESWEFNGKNHDLENAALALEAARLFKVTDDIANKVISSWKPLKGHLELVKKVKNVEFYNDTASVYPYSTISGMSALSENKNLVLIIGGAENNCEYGELYAAIPHHVHTLITIPGSGTLKQRQALRNLDSIKIHAAPSLEEAVRLSLEHSNKGDKVLFSPAFAACGLDRSRGERGERFVKAVRSL